jgi:hypothetical protein
MNGLRFTCEGLLGHNGRLTDSEGHDLSAAVCAVTIRAEVGALATADVRAYAESVDVSADLRRLTLTLRDGREQVFTFPVLDSRLRDSLERVMQIEPPGGLDERSRQLGCWLLANERALRLALGLDLP